MKINVKKTKAMKISKRPSKELLFLCTEDGRGIYEEYTYETSKLIIHSWSVLSHFVIIVALCNKIVALCNNRPSHFVMKQEHAYSGIQVSPAWRLDRK